MGFAEMALVFDKVYLPPAQKLLLLALADRSDATGICWLPIKELASRSCMTPRTVIRHLNDLKSCGIITSQVQRKNEDNGQTRRAMNQYRLNLLRIANGEWSTAVSPNLDDNQNTCSSQDDKLSPRQLDKPENPSSPLSDNLSPRQSVVARKNIDSSSDVHVDTQRPHKVVAALNPEQRSLLAAAIPQNMLAVSSSQKHDFVALLTELINHGWSPKAIKKQLEARPLPSNVHHLAGLVKARLREIPPTPPSAMVEIKLITTTGKPVRSSDVDWGLVAIDHIEAQRRGDPQGILSRKEFALAVGIEKYLS